MGGMPIVDSDSMVLSFLHLTYETKHTFILTFMVYADIILFCVCVCFAVIGVISILLCMVMCGTASSLLNDFGVSCNSSHFSRLYSAATQS